jgi:SAM-dependent methyltransferase
MSATLYGPAFFEGRSHTVSQSAGAVVPHLMQLLEPKSVLDVGCGQGEWLDAFPLADKIGVDIAAPEREGFIRWDITYPMYHLHRQARRRRCVRCRCPGAGRQGTHQLPAARILA